MYVAGILTVLLLTLHGSQGKVQRVASVPCDDEDLIEDSIHNYTLPDLWGVQNISLSDYRGKVRDHVCTLQYAILHKCLSPRPLQDSQMAEKFLQ